MVGLAAELRVKVSATERFVGELERIADEQDGAVNVQSLTGLPGQERGPAGDGHCGSGWKIVACGDLVLQVFAQAFIRKFRAEWNCYFRRGAIPQIIPKSAPKGTACAAEVCCGKHGFNIGLKPNHTGVYMNDGVVI